MSLTKTTIIGSFAASLLITGCTSERFNSPYQSYPRPMPIRAAPIDHISQSQLPPPGETVEDNYGYPQNLNNGEAIEVAAIAAPGNALELSSADVAGVWKATVDGMPCQIATPMTKFGKGYRAGPMRCPVALANINSWNIQGQDLIFYNRDGEVQAKLYSSDGTSFTGRARDGAQITLTR